jgi:ABC-type branched-subunit amino acid transport system permease subunit
MRVGSRANRERRRQAAARQVKPRSSRRLAPLYWLALAFLVVAYAVVWLVTESVTGRVWLAIRDSERRAGVLGLFAPGGIAGLARSAAGRRRRARQSL